jgi:hypothetical protein
MTHLEKPVLAGYFNAYGTKGRHPCLAVLVAAHDVVGAPSRTMTGSNGVAPSEAIIFRS